MVRGNINVSCSRDSGGHGGDTKKDCGYARLWNGTGFDIYGHEFLFWTQEKQLTAIAAPGRLIAPLGRDCHFPLPVAGKL